MVFFHVSDQRGGESADEASTGGHAAGHEPVYRSVRESAGADGLFFLYQEAEDAEARGLPGGDGGAEPVLVPYGVFVQLSDLCAVPLFRHFPVPGVGEG